jgi:hypothetical protein
MFYTRGCTVQSLVFLFSILNRLSSGSAVRLKIEWVGGVVCIRFLDETHYVCVDDDKIKGVVVCLVRQHQKKQEASKRSISHHHHAGEVIMLFYRLSVVSLLYIYMMDGQLLCAADFFFLCCFVIHVVCVEMYCILCRVESVKSEDRDKITHTPHQITSYPGKHSTHRYIYI